MRGSYGREQRPWSKFWVIKIRAVFLHFSSVLKVPFPRDFEGGASFSTFGGGGGAGLCKKGRPWSMSLIMKIFFRGQQHIPSKHKPKYERPVRRFFTVSLIMADLCPDKTYTSLKIIECQKRIQNTGNSAEINVSRN